MQLYSFLLVNSPLIEEQQPRMGIFSPSSLCRQFYVFRRLNPFDSPINVKCSTTIDEVSHWSIVDDGSIWRPSQMSLWRRTGLNNVGTWKARLVPHFPSFKGGGDKNKSRRISSNSSSTFSSEFTGCLATAEGSYTDEERRETVWDWKSK